jgi:hypothetical protein
MLVKKKEERSKDQFEKSFVLGHRPPSLLHSPTSPSCHATMENTPRYYGKITTDDRTPRPHNLIHFIEISSTLDHI